MATKRIIDPAECFAAADRAAWRAWLADNHRSAARVWLTYFKVGSGQPSVAYGEAVEEALCFGWIDTTVQPVDAQRYRQLFVPRKPRSTWSKLNKTRVAALIESGQMTPAGLATIETAKANGSWSTLDDVEDLVLPVELAAAFGKRPKLRAAFESLSRSAKKILLWRIASAKRPETRTNRVASVVSELANNKVKPTSDISCNTTKVVK